MPLGWGCQSPYSGAPALWCTCTLVSRRVRVYDVVYTRYTRSIT